MNSALFHAARPGDIRSGGLGGRQGAGNRPGMREAAAMAKEMGFDQDFGPQAANMWKMLDDLAVTDSAAYAEMAKAGAEALRKPQGKFFVPVAGFVVKASLTRPWAPPPSVDDGSDGGGIRAGRKVVENAPAGTKVFINLCGHEGVSPPIDQADRPVDDSNEGRNASGLRIPMLVSRVRETTDHSDERALAVDVVFHPWVMRSCKGEPMFRDQVVALATGWITQEHPGLAVARRRKLLKLCAYKGGGGPKGAAPVAFPIDDASLQTNPPEDRTREERRTPTAKGGEGSNGGGGGGGLLDDPQSLLAAIKHSAADEDGPTAAASPAAKGGSAETPSTPTTTTPAGEGGQGPAAALGLKPTAGGGVARGSGGDGSAATAARDILLPGALAGLASAGGSKSGANGDQGREGGNRGGKMPGQRRRGPLISEIVPETAKDTPPTAREEEEDDDGGGTEKHASKSDGGGGGNGGRGGGRPSAVKKGFLCSPKAGKGGKGRGGGERAPLYPPSGSENGSEPSAYVKLMSRCKVVDTRDHSKEEMDAAMKAHAGGGTTPSRPSPDARPSPPVPKPSFTAATGGGATVGKSPAVQKGFLGSGGGGGVLYGEEGSREGGAVSGNGGRSSRVDREFDRLMALADPEMGDGGSGTDGQEKDGADNPITEQLAQLAKILGPAAPFSDPAPAAAAAAAAGAEDINPKNPPSPAKKGHTKTPPGARQEAAAEGAQKTAAPATPTEAPTPPTPPTPMPAPTSTITRSEGNNNGTERCPPGKTESSHEATSATSKNAPAAAAPATAAVAPGTAAVAPGEREPVYRVEEAPPRSVNVGGGGRNGKRAFVVTIDLPGLIEGDPGGKRREMTGSQPAVGADGGGASANSANSGGRGRTGKGPSLSDIELDVMPTALELKVPGEYRLRVEMPCVVDDESVTAKLNKSRAVLKVSLQEK